MTTPHNRLRQSKSSENALQRMLWPGTKRPWKERWDIQGPGFAGATWYGEVKESRNTSLAWVKRTLPAAFEQLREATAECEESKALFVALHQVHSPVWLLWVESYRMMLGPYSPEEFREEWLEEQP